MRKHLTLSKEHGEIQRVVSHFDCYSMRKSTWQSVLFLCVFNLLAGCPSAPKQRPPTLAKALPRMNPRHLEARVHQLVNQERKRRGLRSLQKSPRIKEVARKHSQEMARSNFFSHVNLNGEGPIQRGNRAGILCKRRLSTGVFRTGIAENLFQNHLYSAIIYSGSGKHLRKRYQWNTLEQIAQTTVKGWLNSPGHRKNMLHPSYTHAGVGVSISSDGKVYITQNFC